MINTIKIAMKARRDRSILINEQREAYQKLVKHTLASANARTFTKRKIEDLSFRINTCETARRVEMSFSSKDVDINDFLIGLPETQYYPGDWDGFVKEIFVNFASAIAKPFRNAGYMFKVNVCQKTSIYPNMPSSKWFAVEISCVF